MLSFVKCQILLSKGGKGFAEGECKWGGGALKNSVNVTN